MPYRRGAVVLVHYIESDRVGIKRRPGLIVDRAADEYYLKVQSDSVSVGIPQYVFVMITSRLDLVGEPTRILVKLDSPEGQAMGIQSDSLVAVDNITTLHASLIQKQIGTAPASVMEKVDLALKRLLGLS